MDRIEYSEYKDLEKDVKLEKLSSIWKTQQSILRGVVKNTDREKTYFIIYDIKNLEGNCIRNPFTQEPIDSVICTTTANSPLYDRLNIFESVVFKFKISQNTEKDPDRERNRPIIADDVSIKRLIDMETLLNNVLQEGGQATLIDIIKEEYADKRVVFSEEILDLLQDEKANIVEEISNKQNEISKLDVKIKQKLDELSEFTSLRDEKKEELEKELNKTRENTLNEIEKELEDKKNLVDETEKLARKYEEMGFDFYWSNNKSAIKIEGRTDIQNKKEQIDYIQKHLGVREEKELYYDKHIVEMFFSALCTNQIIVLCGDPGTGKTSLVEGLAEAISAEYRLVSVQPNWTDNQDLLGFYNPVEKTYVSTPFLDAITEASQDPERLFIICLDEMNLAHVEYYFSEFLSKIQSKERTLELYSNYIYEQIGQELHAKIKKYGSDDVDIEKALTNDSPVLPLSSNEIDEYLKLKWQWNMHIRYPSSIKIPDNIRFVGTINKDETTKGLSPKVVDRSFVIELGKFSGETKEDIISNKQEYKESYERKLYLSADNFQIKREQDELFSQRMNKIKEDLEKLKVYLNNRFDDQIKQVIGGDVLYDSDKLFDYVVSCMVLPKINVSLEDKESKLIRQLEKQLENTRVSKEIFGKMKNYCDQEHILTFWR